jgi:hypothetical protein
MKQEVVGSVLTSNEIARRVIALAFINVMHLFVMAEASTDRALNDSDMLQDAAINSSALMVRQVN